MKWLLLLSLAACHDEAPTSTPPTPLPAATASTTTSDASDAAAETMVTLGAETHFKSGARGRAGDVTFTVKLLPKLIVSGPQPEIEQAQIEVARGADHAMLQVDTRHKEAEWNGLVFSLGYADVYHDDIELTVSAKK